MSGYEIENISWASATERLKDLEAAGRALLEWDEKYPKYPGRYYRKSTYNYDEHRRLEEELTALIERFRGLLEPKT